MHFFLVLYDRISGKYVTLDPNPSEMADHSPLLKACIFLIVERQYVLMTSGKKSIKKRALAAGTGALIACGSMPSWSCHKTCKNCSESYETSFHPGILTRQAEKCYCSLLIQNLCFFFAVVARVLSFRIQETSSKRSWVFNGCKAKEDPRAMMACASWRILHYCLNSDRYCVPV